MSSTLKILFDEGASDDEGASEDDDDDYYYYDVVVGGGGDGDGMLMLMNFRSISFLHVYHLAIKHGLLANPTIYFDGFSQLETFI